MKQINLKTFMAVVFSMAILFMSSHGSATDQWQEGSGGESGAIVGEWMEEPSASSEPVPTLHLPTCEAAAYDGNRFRNESRQVRYFPSSDQDCIDFGHSEAVATAACTFLGRDRDGHLDSTLDNNGSIYILRYQWLEAGSPELARHCDDYCQFAVLGCLARCNAAAIQVGYQVGGLPCPQGCGFCRP